MANTNGCARGLEERFNCYQSLVAISGTMTACESIIRFIGKGWWLLARVVGARWLVYGGADGSRSISYLCNNDKRRRDHSAITARDQGESDGPR